MIHQLVHNSNTYWCPWSRRAYLGMVLINRTWMKKHIIFWIVWNWLYMDWRRIFLQVTIIIRSCCSKKTNKIIYYKNHNYNNHNSYNSKMSLITMYLQFNGVVAMYHCNNFYKNGYNWKINLIGYMILTIVVNNGIMLWTELYSWFIDTIVWMSFVMNSAMYLW